MKKYVSILAAVTVSIMLLGVTTTSANSQDIILKADESETDDNERGMHQWLHQQLFNWSNENESEGQYQYMNNFSCNFSYEYKEDLQAKYIGTCPECSCNCCCQINSS